MNFSKSKSAGTKTKTVRKTTVQVPVSRPSLNGTVQRPAIARPDPNRHQEALQRPRPTATPTTTKKLANPAQRALASRGRKRKSATPQPGPLFSSDDEDESSSIGGSDSDAPRKRIKNSLSPTDDNGPRRTVISEEAFKDDTIFKFIHGADATSGEYSSKYKPPFEEDSYDRVQLQYPSKSHRERFTLKVPKHPSQEDYRPMEDISETIQTICTYYLPDELTEKGLDDEEGWARRFKKAWLRESIEDFMQVVEDFNKLLRSKLEDGTVEKELRLKARLHLDWVCRILVQTYGRTVSPKVETLRKYENGSDNVYGELLPRLCSEIFQRTKLNHEQVFVDLGSGVGNVVLQAALEVGCESWGIEQMKNPSELAELQAKELRARSRLWGLSIGQVQLLRGDFTDTPDIDEVLRRADVVLVNNQAFTPALNDKLGTKFLDLKEGCQVVSLKPFVQEGHKITKRNLHSVSNVLVQDKFYYYSESVSWADGGGSYYIAKKDRRPLEAFIKSAGLDS